MNSSQSEQYFKEMIAPTILKYQSPVDIGAEFDRLTKMFPAAVNRYNYAEAKGISQLKLSQCIRAYESQLVE